MSEFQALTQALVGFGWQGVVFALVVLIGVYIARRAGLVASGNQARIANLVLSAVLAGLSNNPQAESALLAAISAMLAGLAHEAIVWITDYVRNAASSQTSL